MNIGTKEKGKSSTQEKVAKYNRWKVDVTVQSVQKKKWKDTKEEYGWKIGNRKPSK